MFENKFIVVQSVGKFADELNSQRANYFRPEQKFEGNESRIDPSVFSFKRNCPGSQYYLPDKIKKINQGAAVFTTKLRFHIRTITQ